MVPTSLVPMVSDLTVLHSYICLPLPGGLEVKKSPHNFKWSKLFLVYFFMVIKGYNNRATEVGQCLHPSIGSIVAGQGRH